jgi:hypothetical protein
MEKVLSSALPLVSREGIRELMPFLTVPVACQIEEALRRVGDFGEVRLVVVKGKLRFIQVMRSENVQED